MSTVKKFLMESSQTITPKSEFRVTRKWKIGDNFRGYAAIMDERLLTEVREIAEVKYVERNQVVKALQSDCETQYGAPWNLVRVRAGYNWDPDPNDPPNEFKYMKKHGEGVTVYIIDTGLDETHYLFQGRAIRGVDFVDNPPPNEGDPMQWTWNTYCCWVVSGISYVASQKNKGDRKKVVANMSLGGTFSQALNDATNACVEKGVHMTVAAGGGNVDACTTSPAGAEKAFAAASSDISDNYASFSNYGRCIGIIAPGSNIISTTPNNGTAAFSGTSMAAPHAAGVIAKFLSESDEWNDLPAAMKVFVKSFANKNIVKGVPPDTDNDLLYDSCYPI